MSALQCVCDAHLVLAWVGVWRRGCDAEWCGCCAAQGALGCPGPTQAKPEGLQPCDARCDGGLNLMEMRCSIMMAARAFRARASAKLALARWKLYVDTSKACWHGPAMLCSYNE
eukprot:3172687-Rhodomonas_salina.3